MSTPTPPPAADGGDPTGEQVEALTTAVDDNTRAADANTAGLSKAAGAAASGEQVDANTEATLANTASADDAPSAKQIERLIASADANTASNDRYSVAMTEYQERRQVADQRELNNQHRFRATMLALLAGGMVILIGFIVVVAVILVKFGAVLTRLDQNAVDGKVARDRLLSCTTPGAKCYDDGQKQAQAQTAAALAVLFNNQLNIAACSGVGADLTPAPRKAAIARCVHDLG